MKKIEKLNLIEGTFSHEDANEILMNIFSNKINFHEMNNFRSQERLGKEDDTAKKRITELKKEIEKVLQILSEAKSNNKKLVITSKICISLLD